MKMRQDNDMTNRISTVYDENEAELQHDWSYRCGICQKRNWTAMIDSVQSISK